MTAMTEMSTELTDTDLHLLDAYWRAANYLAAGQIYLLDNPLLREPLRPEHIKPRLLGHWGTTPGLNLVYTHMNRLIRAHDLEAIFITGPGHGGPALVAQTYLEGTYGEVYHHIDQNEAGMRALFRQFSFPGGIPSHVAAEVPGSIHEGGELGYALAHAYGAAFDNPGLLVCCVIGDGEAETGPTGRSLRRWRPPTSRSSLSSRRPGWRVSARGPRGRSSCCARRRAGRVRGRSTGSRSRGPGGPTRSRSRTSATTRTIWLSSSGGCAVTGRRSCSTTPGRWPRCWRRCRHAAIAG